MIVLHRDLEQSSFAWERLRRNGETAWGSTSDKTLPQRINHSKKMQKELFIYKAEALAELNSDPLQWWQNRMLSYPIMSALVQSTFAFTATSVPSERLFSSAEMIISTRRCSFLPDNADKLILLYENSH